MAEEIINKVAASALTELNLEEYYPKEEVLTFDLKPFLFMELILKEKDFREALLKHDWTIYQDKIVGVTCSADAIIPVWAYMIIASYLEPFARDVIFGDGENAFRQTFLENLKKIDVSRYTDKRVVVKGCGDLPIGEFAYLQIAKMLRPVAKSIMYGEPCSTVPVFKKK